MTADHWQLREAEQRFGELLSAVHDKGPQFVTRHGKEIVVVLDIAAYRQLRVHRPDFKLFLASAPNFDELEVERDSAHASQVDFTQSLGVLN